MLELLKSILTSIFSSYQECSHCGTARAAKQISLNAQSFNEPKDHAKSTAKVNNAEMKEPSIHDGNVSRPSGQTVTGTGVADGVQPRLEQRKRDKLRSVVRKMVPGAGIAVGMAVLVERILEIVVNVS